MVRLTILAAISVAASQSTAPSQELMELDESWCQTMQQRLPGMPDGTEIEVVKVTAAGLDSCHTKYEAKADGGLKLTLCDTVYQNNDPPQWMPEYAGAGKIACKFIGEDRIAQLLNAPLPDMNSMSVQNRCSELNGYAVAEAIAFVQKYWPEASERFAAQGKQITLANDNVKSMGPMWLLADLSIQETSDGITVKSPALISKVTSMIYPGNHYCKLLSPSKVADIILTTGLTERSAAAAESMMV